MPKSDDKNLEALEAVFHEAALEAAENGDATPEDREWAAALRAKLEQRVATARRNQELPEVRPAKPIRPAFLAMARDALIARIEQLVLAGRPQLAHRNLNDLSDDDLRRLLDRLDPEVE